MTLNLLLNLLPVIAAKGLLNIHMALSPVEARPRQELVHGRSKFKKFKRSTKQGDTFMTCTRSPRPIRIEDNSQPVVQKSLCAADSTKRLDNYSKGEDVVVDHSRRKLINHQLVTSRQTHLNTTNKAFSSRRNRSTKFK